MTCGVYLVMTDDYEDYPPGDPTGLPVIDGAVEVYLRGPAVDVAAVQAWIVARAAIAEAVTDDDPERRGGAICRMVVVPPEE